MTDDKDRKILSDEELEDVAGGGPEEPLASDISAEELGISKGGGGGKKKQDVQLVDIRLETFRKA